MMRKCTFAAIVFVLVVVGASAQQQPLPIQDGQVIPLWSGTAPGALGTEDRDIPAITVFLPRTLAPNTPAVIVCPGGGYTNLASNHEGRQVANYFNSLGVAAFVLRYRLGPRYHHPVELGDAQRAIRTLRSHATEWRLDPARIGIMGFSAGGHLAMTASTRFDAGNTSATDTVDRVGSRPDFTDSRLSGDFDGRKLDAPGIEDQPSWEQPDPELAKSLSGEQAVTKDTPPTFIFHTNADTAVPAENSVQYYLALRKSGVPAEMHIFEKGPHGVGLANDDPALSEWSKLLANWLRVRGIVK
jgi:acetyl esterase/lipase